MASYLCGIDIGGTFTDCVVVDESGQVTTAKVPSTPDDFARGMLDALAAAAAKLQHSVEELCASIALLSHGTTVGTNTVIQRSGAKVGLITTKGHNDVIHIMRGSRGFTGRDIRKVVHFSEGSKPRPALIPKRLIEGVSERVDCLGQVVVSLNEAEARAAVRRLVEAGVEAIAVCFLWSFKHPAHEQRIQEIIAQIAPNIFVTCSSDLAPKWGEYERTTAVALNAYIGPRTSGYLRNIEAELQGLGYRHPLQITQCGGGTISAARALEAPLLTLDSGPVSGITGSKYVGDACDFPNIITTDMGGTSFDVGIVHGGEPAFSYVSHVNQYEYFLPKVDIQAIGSGGGSLVWIDEVTGNLRVGPDSAGAVPGPACYGRGGDQATVTDADLVLGYLNPDNFAGGTLRLDLAAAKSVIDRVAEKLGLDRLECASGIAKIAEFQMADLIRKVTIQKGFDPRDFILFAFGGAGPAHAGVFARELGVDRVVVPQKETASVWCAFGAAAADVLHVHELVDIMVSPFEQDTLRARLLTLADRAESQLSADGIAADGRRLNFSLDMRHKGQINEVEVPLGADEFPSPNLSILRARFAERYEQLYGKGSSFRGARAEIVTFRVRAVADTPKPRITATNSPTRPPSNTAKQPARQVYWDSLGQKNLTPVYDGHALQNGNTFAGPAIVETNDTTVVVQPGQTLTVDVMGNFVIDLKTRA